MKAYDSAKASAISVADATIKKEILAQQVEQLTLCAMAGTSYNSPT